MLNVQAVFERASALPEDRVINTFTFLWDTTGAPIGDRMNAIRDALDDFYFLNTAGGSSIRAYLSNTLKSLTYRGYNSFDPEPREATVRPSTDFLAPPAGNPLPSEVSVVASFYAGRNLPRQRGRVYLGPLSQTASNAPSSTDIDSRPATLLITTIAQAMARLRDATGIAATPWAVHSTVDNLARVITSGWVDNAFDTQRRRGASATSRTLVI
jgi:hypothetical protein